MLSYLWASSGEVSKDRRTGSHPHPGGMLSAQLRIRGKLKGCSGTQKGFVADWAAVRPHSRLPVQERAAIAPEEGQNGGWCWREGARAAETNQQEGAWLAG